MVRNDRTTSGFSLIEMMVTVAIVGVALTAILTAISGTMAAESRVEKRAVAQDLLLLKTDEFSGATGPMSPKKGTFAAPFEDYNWRVEIQTTENQGLQLLQTEISWAGRSRTTRIRANTLVPQQ